MATSTSGSSMQQGTRSIYSIKPVMMSIPIDSLDVQIESPVDFASLKRNGVDMCHTLILDLKILLQISFLPLILFRFTVFYSTIFYCALNAYFTFSVFNSLAYKAIRSVFLALQVIKDFLKPLHIFLHFYFKFLHKIIQKGYFGHFLQWNSFWSLPFVSESFQLFSISH